MAIFDNKASLSRLSQLLELSFSHICIATFDYHAECIFPVNILLMVTRDEKRGCDFIEIPSAKQRAPLRANHVYFVPCGLPVRFDISPGITTLAFHFNLSFLCGFDIFSGSTRWEMRRDRDFTARMLRLAGKEKNELKAICALKMEAMRFCLSCWPDGVERRLPAMRKYEAVFRHVREHGDAELAVRDLADMAGQRQDVFSRAFSRDIGKSPKELIQSDLLKKISARLLLPQASVKQVASELKFNNAFYMSRFFKRHTGISPSEYQRKFRP